MATIKIIVPNNINMSNINKIITTLMVIAKMFNTATPIMINTTSNVKMITIPNMSNINRINMSNITKIITTLLVIAKMFNTATPIMINTTSNVKMITCPASLIWTLNTLSPVRLKISSLQNQSRQEPELERETRVCIIRT